MLKPSSKRSERAVPSSRSSRMMGMGALAGRLAQNVIAEGSRQLLKGQKPRMSDLLLTKENVGRVTDQLARMRGAAMKVGQLVSMDAGNLLPRELADILARLQDDAIRMPATQWSAILEKSWGADWQEQFSRFSFDPIAAASIGQVHEATDRSGRHMAIKIQYPGVAKSIDSDVANVVSLLKMSGLVPKSLDLEPLIIEARAQLHLEADYRHEGQQMRDYASAVLSMDQADSFLLPEWFDELSTEQILCMSFLKGAPLASIPPGSLEASRVMSELFRLFFAELLCFGRVQTDPNLANFSYQSDTGKIILLDFGAVRTYAADFVKNYQAALEAATANDAVMLGDALQILGFFQDNINATNRSAVIDIFLMAAEPLRTSGLYDFGTSDLASRIQQRGMSISSDPQAWHTPPPDVLFLHRKMAGLYLMAARLAAKVDVSHIFKEAVQRRP